MVDNSTVLSVDVDLTSLQRPLVTTNTASLSLDWSQLTTNGFGRPWVSGDIDQVLLGRYDNYMVADLEDDFLDIEIDADQLWTLDLDGGSVADLSELADFSGCDDQATWLLALRCTTCTNPAPPFYTVFESCP